MDSAAAAAAACCRLAGLCLGAQWACFVPAYLLATESFYDLAGAATHLAALGYAARLFPPRHSRAWIQLGLVGLWTVRLGGYLGYRGWREGDRRFVRLKKRPGPFLAAWTMQGVWVLANLAPSLVACGLRSQRRLSPVELAGWAVFAAGFITEAVADWQKWQFRRDPANAGRFISGGLWSVSRHPNYFGELCLWSGLALAASASFSRPLHFASLAGPAINACLILFVSGLPLLERSAEKRWGAEAGYREYVRRTPLLVPFVPFPRPK